MSFKTTPTPPPRNNPGGRPRRYEDLAQALETAPDGEWVIVPPRPDAKPSSIRTALKRYFPNRKIRSRIGGDDTLYIRLGGTKS